MHTPETEDAAAAVPIAERWRRLRAAYRVYNKASHHLLGFTLKLALVLYFAFAALVLLLRYAILPNIDYYKSDIERLAGRALGSQVSIARIYASWSGMRPNLFLGDVVLRDRQGRPALTLPSVSATLSWLSVPTLQPRFSTLEIIRPSLDVRRGVDGTFYVAGIPLRDQTGGGDPDWAFKQHRIVIREGRVQWTDQQRGAATLQLEDVNLVLLNRWRHHRFALRATPPASLAAPVDIRADFRHPSFAKRIADVSMWKGELYADIADTDLAAWRRYIDYPFTLTSGKGSVRAWMTLDRARLAAFTADVGLIDVSARLGRDLPPLQLARVRGRLSAEEAAQPRHREGKPAFGANGHSITLSDFSLTTASGRTLAPTRLSEAFTPRRERQAEKIEVSASELDLEILAELAGQLPMSPTQRAMLADFAPRGRLSQFSAEWSGSYPHIERYRVRGKLDGLAMRPQAARLARPAGANTPALAAVPAMPGVENLSGSIDASEQGGTLTLDSQQLVLQLPAWFAEPTMPFEQFSLRARWEMRPHDRVQVSLEKLQFAQGELKASLAGTHEIVMSAKPGQPAGLIDLHGELSGFQINTIGRYLPLKTPEHLRDWLIGALEGGVADDVKLRLRGDLAHFPFNPNDPLQRGKGEFYVGGKLRNGRLNYAPSLHAPDGVAPLWPQAERIDGSFVFDRTRMEIRGDTARTLGVGLSGVKAVVADLTAHESLLEIDGNAAGPMQEFLRYVTASPVAGWIGHFTDDTRATGNARLALKLRMPLHHMIDTKVNGTLQLSGNDVHLLPDLPPLQAALGKIEFTEHGVALNGVGASFLGGPLALTGGSQRDNSIAIRMSGTVSADGLRRQYSSQAVQPIVGKLSGAARFAGLITVKDHQLQVSVDSNLAGLGLDLPAPAAKVAGEVLPARFTLVSQPTIDRVGRDDLTLTLGNGVSARYARQRLPGGAWTVLRGGIGVNVPAPEPDSGMQINAHMKTLNVDQWIALAKSVTAARAQDVAGGAASGGPDLSQYVVPQAIAARANELLIGERKLDNVVVGASHQGDTWQVSIDSHQVSGHVSWDEASGGGLGKVTARLASLIIPESAAADVKDLLEGQKSAASTIPGLDIVAERFELFNKQLGRLELVANNTLAAAGREWRINRLTLVNGDGVFAASGRWVARAGQSTTNLAFNLDIDDAGRLLTRLGFPDTLKRGKGKLSGEIAWNGLPYSLDIPSLSGKIKMNVESGQFLKQEPGAAKLLGVLSLQMLPRMLKLDFKDVFSEGLAFDGISADAIITRGVLRTDNLKMHGVAATVIMAGTADIANESTNLHVVVIPEFNLGTGPLVYALAVNPVVGLGSFLAQLFLREPMMKAMTYEMQVTGPWKAPIITKLGGNRAPPSAPTAK